MQLRKMLRTGHFKEESHFCRAEVAEWFTAPSLLHAARVEVGLSPEPMLADMPAGTWIKKAQLPC